MGSTPGSIWTRRSCWAPTRRNTTKPPTSWTCGSIPGVVHHCLSQLRPEITAPADLYLEGSDQHRGWFHSSLLTSVAMHGRAPYRAVLTHGFTVDEKGRKMSKSVGNTLVPQKLTSTLGADVVRLWIAATDYANEMSVSDEILKRMADSYRRMRNTLRFLLSNMHGFDPVKHAVPWSDLVAIDRWAIRKAFTLQNDVVTAFRNYEFHDIYQKVHNFCVVELGGLLSGHPQGSLVHDRERQPAAALSANRDVPRRRCHGALARADLEFHRGGSVELSAR